MSPEPTSFERRRRRSRKVAGENIVELCDTDRIIGTVDCDFAERLPARHEERGHQTHVDHGVREDDPPEAAGVHRELAPYD